MEKWAKMFYYHYSVSSKGRVRNDETGKILKHQRSKRGGMYPFVNLYKKGIRKNRTAHGLVASAFLGKRPMGCVIHHKDANINNPALANLEYITWQKNLSLRHFKRK